jgi:hypothetical protein
MFTSALGETTSTSGFAPARWRRDLALASGVVASVLLFTYVVFISVYKNMLIVMAFIFT